jgi:peptidoglycan/LPS O-acetylase OafA/YrhL
MLRKLYEQVVPPSPEESPPAPGRYPLIDSTRALAALSIFCFHLASTLDLPNWTKDYTNTFAAGVPVFFVISGFVLYRPFARAQLADVAPPKVGPYAWRRFLRIVPAYYLALTIFLVFGPRHESLGQLPALYGFAQVYDPSTVLAGLAPAWSLDCEVLYYALIPLVVLAVLALPAANQSQRLSRQITALALLFGLSLAYKLWFFSWGGNPAFGRDQVFQFQPGWNLDLFVLGMAVAVWSANRELTGVTDRVAGFIERRAWVLWLGAVVLFFVLSWNSSQAFDDVGSVLLHYGAGLFGLCILLPAIWGAPGDGVVRRVLGNRYLLALGVVSYSFYLFHKMVLNQVVDAWPDRISGTAGDVGIAVVALAGSIAISVVVYLLVERPAMSLKRYFPDDSRSAGPQQPLAAHAGTGGEQ